MLNKKFVQVNIVDNDNGPEGMGCMDSYILVIPNDEMTHYETKLQELQEMLDNRQDEENEFFGNFGAIYDYLLENFEILDISQIKEIEW